MAKSTSQVSSDRRRRRSEDDPAAQLKGRRFGRVLTKLGKITRDQVHEALRVQRARREKGDRDLIGQILIELGLIGDFDVLEALAGQSGMRFVRFEPDDIDASLVAWEFFESTCNSTLPLSIEPALPSAQSTLQGTWDMLGRPCPANAAGQLVIERLSNGEVRKVFRAEE